MIAPETEYEGTPRTEPATGPPSSERGRLLSGPNWTTVLIVAVVLTSIAASAAMAYALGSNHGYQRAVTNFEKALENAIQADAVVPDRDVPNQEAFPPLPSEPAARPQGHHFDGSTLDGESFDLAQTRGQPTLIVFWTHW